MEFLRRGTKTVVVALCAQIVTTSLYAAGGQGNVPSGVLPGAAYSFVYLGDLHFDRMSHHDLAWVRANKPNDTRQIDGYVASTERYAPGLLRQVNRSIESSNGRIKMVVQGGDLTEGLCGSMELQETQFREVRTFIREIIPETKFLMTKGNHDITGPGARDAFDRVILPWLSSECGKPINSASFLFLQGPDLFIFFDAYHNNNLEWLEQTLRQNKHRHVFVVMHPPAVPYNARSTWHLFWREQEKEVRARFLDILGANRAILLTAHLHKYAVVARKTSRGAFVQLSMNSVVSSPNPSVRDYLEGASHYGGTLVELEPEFQPETEAQRRRMLEDEKPYITSFEFADFPGYAVVNVSDAGITGDIVVAGSARAWKSVSLTAVLDNAN